MDQIASVIKLQKCLEAISISDDYTQLQNLITELHFAYESFRFGRETLALSDQRTLWDAAYYLLTALTNPQRQLKMTEDDVQDGLAISGLVFELLGRYIESLEDINIEQDCFLNAAICNTLSRYEANSAVLAKKYFNDSMPLDARDYLSRPAVNGMNMFFALLAREFFWIRSNGPRLLEFFDLPDQVLEISNDTESEYTEEATFWLLVCKAIVRFSDFMVDGKKESYAVALTDSSQARQVALEYSLLSEHWIASRLLDCMRRMEKQSTWRVLREQGFSESYISTLTRFPWNAVHELWQSQIEALTKVQTPNHPEQNNILSHDVNRVIISMPTSAGKTLLAEMMIVRTLQRKPKSKCVYVAPTRALVDEVETKLHRRLRFLGYNVASIVGAFEVGDLEREELEKTDVAVLTPEKLDYLFRKREPFVDHIELIVFDEVHKIGEGKRGWFLETLITWLLLKPKLKDTKMVFMSAVLPHSQQHVRLWIGQQSLASIIPCDWSPTRQLIAVLWYSSLDVEWSEPIEQDQQGYRYYWGDSANLTFRYNIGGANRTLTDLYRLRFWVEEVDGRYKRVGHDQETKYDRCFKLIKLLDAENSVLVYFQRKGDLVSFCRRAPEQLKSTETEELARLVQYISKRLGPGFPIVDSLPYGVAFHHGDLPTDVRNEIERAYRDKVIRILACTTTLTEGVNLPIHTFILGYHQTWNKYRLSVRDFKNIIGRAGRALVETEGKIIAICHPEFSAEEEDLAYFNSLVQIDESQLAVRSEFPPHRSKDDLGRVINELDELTQAIKDAQDLADIEYVEELADEVQRLQVFIFTLFEDDIIDATPESINNALQYTFLFVQNSNVQVRRAVSGLSQRFATVCSQMDSARLRRFNTSGLRFKSNVLLEQLAKRIVSRCATFTKEQYRFESVISHDDLQFILDEIYEAKPKRVEYGRQFTVIENLDHYGVLIAWIKGNNFSHIRDSFFGQSEYPVQLSLFPRPDKTGTRTTTCQSYISKQFTFKLPWVLAALHTHAEKFGNSTLNSWLEFAPVMAKYGVDTREAAFLSSIGVRSRFLARTLAELYRKEHGNLDSDWQTLGDWFRGLSPFYLQEKALGLPDLAIRQTIRRANTIRPPGRELRRTGIVAFYIAGWQYYNGETFIAEILEQMQKEDEPLVYLQPEPKNSYDEYAVSIHWRYPSQNNKLGYVPRAYNEEISLLLTLGTRLEAQILRVGFAVNSNGWRRVDIQVRLLPDEQMGWL